MLYQYKGIRPKLGKDVFLAPGAIVLGNVEIGDGTNIWFYSVLRGDVNTIKIGQMCNIQDHCMLHVTTDRFPLTLGNEIIVGHRAVLHGCTIHDNALIGIGAIVLDGAVIQEGAIIAAGAVVAPGTVIPANRVAVGIPARPTREPTPEDREYHKINSARYYEYACNFNKLVEPVIV